MSFYLDASVLVPLFVTEPSSQVIEDWVRSVSDELFVADFAAAEFHSGISRRIRTGELSRALAVEVRNAFEHWRQADSSTVESVPGDIRTAARLAQTPTPRLLTPDAIHLAACMRLGLTLVTNDAGLRGIAEREGISSLSLV